GLPEAREGGGTRVAGGAREPTREGGGGSPRAGPRPPLRRGRSPPVRHRGETPRSRHLSAWRRVAASPSGGPRSSGRGVACTPAPDGGGSLRGHSRPEW